MNKRDFVKDRERAWNRFEQLLNRISRKSLKRLPSREVNEFSRLLRELANDLAVIRSRGWGQQLAGYLNGLISRGYNFFYTSPPGYLRGALDFLSGGFPRLLRANIWYFAVACGLFFGPLFIAWAVIQSNPELAKRVVPEGQLVMAKRMYAKPLYSADESETAAERRKRLTEYGEQRSAMSGFYIRHNISIAFRSFASGIFAGIGTVYTLLFNGIAIGAIAGFVVAEADPDAFLSFVITHGSFELTAIAVSGAGGLVIGNALLHPGQRTRWEALKHRGMDAIKLAIGAGIMLFVAALIEAYWSPSPIPSLLKYIVGTIAWIVVILYFVIAGRGSTERAAGDAPIA